MIIHDAPQGEPGWYQARTGAITGSMFGEVMKTADGLTEQQQRYVDAILAGNDAIKAKEIAGYKSAPKSGKIDMALAGERVGDWTTAAKDYAFRLAVERISGHPLDDGQFETWAMRRGKELEPEARLTHEIMCAVSVDPCGFISTDDGKFGVSADGLIGKDDGAEYKCFVDPAKLRAIYMEGDIGDVVWQVQGGLWLTGRKRWHFGLYCPALASIRKALKVIVFDRDEPAIAEMENRLVEFDALVEQYRAQLIDPVEQKVAA